jgi:hypothetical protein
MLTGTRNAWANVRGCSVVDGAAFLLAIRCGLFFVGVVFVDLNRPFGLRKFTLQVTLL